jgi:ribosome-associated protein
LQTTTTGSTVSTPTTVSTDIAPLVSTAPRGLATAERVDDPEQLLALLCAAADETKAQDMTILDVRGQTIVADFFVVCTGTSTTHIQAIARNVQDHLRADARRRAKPEGDSESLWIVLDYSDVILHVFDAQTREFYDLERLWADAKVTRYISTQENPAAVASGSKPEATEA